MCECEDNGDILIDGWTRRALPLTKLKAFLKKLEYLKKASIKWSWRVELEIRVG